LDTFTQKLTGKKANPQPKVFNVFLSFKNYNLAWASLPDLFRSFFDKTIFTTLKK